MPKPNSRQLERIDANTFKVLNPFGIDVSLFANENVPIEQIAIDELNQMLELQKTVEAFSHASPESFERQPQIKRVVLTPDFHKARGIPVGTTLETEGFIVPQAIGNDINCGMRLHLTDLDGDRVAACCDELETECRSMYFEAGRSIPMKGVDREAMLLGGIQALYESVDSSFDEGLWAQFHRQPQDDTLARIEQRGSLSANRVIELEKFIGKANKVTRDSQIGSIGGGNHFVEFQRVGKILNGQVAHAWGIKEGMTTVMVHTGSVSIGHSCGGLYQDKVRRIYPSHLKHPQNGIFVMPIGELHSETSAQFWDSMYNAANFAFANRMFLAYMAWATLEKCFGNQASGHGKTNTEIQFDLLYDAPHNLLWRENHAGNETILHRKGACPARDFNAMKGTPFEYYGEPVLVPGSMGASSYILAGNGFAGSLQSAAHGAGRAVSRGTAMKGFDREFEKFLEEFRVVTPVDFRRQEIKHRREIINKKLADLKQEAPFAYKGIGPVIETITDSGIARPVAELKPILTVKG